MEPSPPQTGEYTPPKPSLLARLLRPKVAIPLTLLALLILSPVLIRGYYLSRVPDFPEPFDRAEVYAVSIPDEENAFEHYRMATSLFIAPSSEVRENLYDVLDHGWTLATPDLKQHLHDNEDALLEWKAGSEREQAQYIRPEEFNYTTLLPATQELRSFSKLASALSYQLEAEGRPSEAWPWLRAVIRASRHSGANGAAIERLVGAAMFADAAKRMETLSANPALSGNQIRQMIENLQHDWTLTPQPSHIFKYEYLIWIQTIEAAQAGHSDVTWKNLDLDELSNPFLRYIQGEPERGKRIVRFYMNNQLMFADQPRYDRPPATGRAMLFDDPAGLQFGGIDWSVAEFDAALTESALADFSIPPTAQILNACDNEAARFATILVVLAAQAYFRDLGEFPESLADLVPEYLPELPPDPFDGRPIRYHFAAADAIVYSIGDDGIDDRGDLASKPPLGAADLGYRLIGPAALPLVAPRPMEADAD